MPWFDDAVTDNVLRRGLGKRAYQYAYDNGGRRLPKVIEAKEIRIAVARHAKYRRKIANKQYVFRGRQALIRKPYAHYRRIADQVVTDETNQARLHLRRVDAAQRRLQVAPAKPQPQATSKKTFPIVDQLFDGVQKIASYSLLAVLAIAAIAGVGLFLLYLLLQFVLPILIWLWWHVVIWLLLLAIGFFVYRHLHH